MPDRQTDRLTDRQTDRQTGRQTGTHMFIGCSSHTHESDMEPSKSYYGNKYTHTHEQQNKPGAKSRIHTPKFGSSFKKRLVFYHRNRRSIALYPISLPTKSLGMRL